MKNMYRAWLGKIFVVEVERATAASVWVKGRREARICDYQRYFDTWEEAHQFLTKEKEVEIKIAKHRLKEAESELAEIMSMKNPKEGEEK